MPGRCNRKGRNPEAVPARRDLEVRLFDCAAGAFAPEILRASRKSDEQAGPLSLRIDSWLLPRNDACIRGFRVVMTGLGCVESRSFVCRRRR